MRRSLWITAGRDLSPEAQDLGAGRLGLHFANQQPAPGSPEYLRGGTVRGKWELHLHAVRPETNNPHFDLVSGIVSCPICLEQEGWLLGKPRDNGEDEGSDTEEVWISKVHRRKPIISHEDNICR